MRALLVALLLLIGSLAPLTTAASDDIDPPAGETSEAPVYLALGDSLAFGAGASNPLETGYVPLLHASLRERIPCGQGGQGGCPRLRLVNLAEIGATTTTLLQTQLPRALALIEQRNNDGDPGNDVVVITIDIGGNDAVHALLDVCSASISAACGRAVQQTLATVGANLTTILTQLRVAAGPDTRIAIMTYYNSFLACDQRDFAANADLVLEGLTGLFPGLNDVIRLAAELTDATVADTFGKLDASDLAGGTDCLHANDAGYQKITQLFLSALVADREPAIAR